VGIEGGPLRTYRTEEEKRKILGEDARKKLYDELLKDPTLKEKIYEKLYMLGASGVNI
jgi:hypothetical protein